MKPLLAKFSGKFLILGLSDNVSTICSIRHHGAAETASVSEFGDPLCDIVDFSNVLQADSFDFMVKKQELAGYVIAEPFSFVFPLSAR